MSFQKLSIKLLMIFASFVSRVSVLTFCPVDLLKVRAQVNKSNQSLNYMQELSKVVQREGGVRGLYKGVWPQVARDIPGRGIYFFAYDSIQKLLLHQGRKVGEE